MRLLGILTVVVCLLASGLTAQETRGMINGTITDPQGGVVVGAAVVLTHTETGVTTRLVTSSKGYYEASLLPPGNYQLSAEAPGFKKAVRNGVNLSVSQQLEIDFSLQVGAVTETIAVSAEAPLLDTTSVSSGRTVDPRSLGDLPAMGSNPVLFIKMAPGVQTNGNNPYVASGFVGKTSYYMTPEGVGGNEWSIDGVSNNGSNRRVASTPNTDMVQEMRIETSNFDAAFGHSSGVNVSMVTKSGVNTLHGTANWQHWDQRWNASGFFQKQNFYSQISAARTRGDLATADKLADSAIQPAGHSNSGGATIGGPIYIPKIVNGKNKLFFFFSYQWQIDLRTSDLSSINNTIPTMANRDGDFSRLLDVGPRYQVYDPLTVRPDPARATHVIRNPFSGNIIPKARMINPMYKAYTDLLPKPNDDPFDSKLEPLNNYKAWSEPQPVHTKVYGSRFDYNHSDKHRFFFRWSYSDFLEQAGAWLYETAPGLEGNDNVRQALSGVLDWTYTINSTTLLNVQMGGNNFKEGFPRYANAQFKPSTVGLPAYLDQKCGDQCALPQVSWSGYTGLGLDIPDWTSSRQLSGKVDLTKIVGSHSMRAGFDTRQHFRTNRAPGAGAGSFSFSNSYTRKADDTTVSPAGDLGLSWAAFYLGMPNGITIATTDNFAIANPYHAVYYQDSWRVKRNLTLNLGMRMEYEGGPRERYDRMLSYFDPTLKLPITDAAVAAYAAKPLAETPANLFKVLGGSTFAGVNGHRDLYKGEYMFLPRFSAAWQMSQNTVIRGGYGWYFDSLNVMNSGISQSGYSRSTSPIVTTDFGQTWNVGNPAGGVSALTDPFPVRADGTRFDAQYGNKLGGMQQVGGGVGYTPYDARKHPRVQRWRVGVQRQLGQSMVLEAAYQGSFGDRLSINNNLSALPASYFNTTNVRNNAIALDLNQNLPNPFNIANFTSLRTSDPVIYDYISKSAFFTSTTIQKNRLMRAFPQTTGVTINNVPDGKVRNTQIEVSFEKRFSKGFNFNFGFTNTNVQEKTFLPNEYDTVPMQWIKGNSAKPYRLTATTIYELPFGRGRALLKSGILNHIAGGWQIAVTAEAQPGSLLGWGNLFFYGDTADIKVDSPNVLRWFNVDAGFEKDTTKTPAAYQARVFPTIIDGVRADGVKLVNSTLQRDFKFLERFNMQLRLDTMNTFNRSHFSGPNTTTTSTNFGKVTTATETTNRFIQIQARLRF